MTLLAIDPGGTRKGCSAAEFDRRPLLVRVYPVARHHQFTGAYDEVVVELPQQDGRSRAVPPKVLIDLAWNAGLLAGACSRTISTYTPAEWKGTTPKAVHHHRMIQALTASELSVLTPFRGWYEEHEAALEAGAASRWAPHANGHYPRHSKLPDVLDSLALGLFHLKRIDQSGNPR